MREGKFAFKTSEYMLYIFVFENIGILTFSFWSVNYYGVFWGGLVDMFVNREVEYIDFTSSIFEFEF